MREENTLARVPALIPTSTHTPFPFLPQHLPYVHASSLSTNLSHTYVHTCPACLSAPVPMLHSPEEISRTLMPEKIRENKINRIKYIISRSLGDFLNFVE